jgi:RHS repeat-associated protein
VVGSGFSLDMRAHVDLADLDTATGVEPCSSGAFVDLLTVMDGDSGDVLWGTGGRHTGELTSDWLQPAAGHLQLAIMPAYDVSLPEQGLSTGAEVTGDGHCSNASQPCGYGDPGCSPGCKITCDGLTSKSQSGAVVGSYEYRRYETGQVPFWTPLRFPGQYYDAESDLFENWNRYYDTTTNRYLQTEPLLSGSASAIQINAMAERDLPSYSYATSNPVEFTDPNGLYSTTGNCDEWVEKQKGAAACKALVDRLHMTTSCESDCVKNECDKLEVHCDENHPDCKDPSVFGSYPSAKKGNLSCQNAGTGPVIWCNRTFSPANQPNDATCTTRVLVHEMAHACGMRHGNNGGDQARWGWVPGFAEGSFPGCE